MTNDAIEVQQADHIKQLKAAYVDVLKQLGYGGVLISSGAAPLRYADDQAHHHHGYGHFLHWTGLTGVEHSWLLVERDGTVRLWLHTPDDFWHAPPTLPTEPWTHEITVSGKQTPEPPDATHLPGQLAVIGDPSQIANAPGAPNPPSLIAALDELRLVKSDYEINCIKQANRIAAAGHQAAREAFLDGASEFGINLAYQQATGQREALAPYHSIIGLNENAGILHYQHYDTAPPPRRHSLLVDAGVRYRGYCSDITRTTGAPDQARFRALIGGLDQLQQRLCEAVTPGVEFAELHQKAHWGLAALLRSSDLVQGLSEEAITERGITRAFFPHGLGHLLGIQVHDVAGKPVPAPENAPFLRLTRSLEKGMVITIEPGLYIIPSLLEPLLNGADGRHLNHTLINELKGCGGIRIEDNVVVTSQGSQNLTRPYLPD
ncbi:Xaa-Pro dipeptidase [Halomonadaceae bacterium KBTZ08]